MAPNKTRMARLVCVTAAALLAGSGCALGQRVHAIESLDDDSAVWEMTQLDLQVTLAPQTHSLRGRGTMRVVAKGASSSDLTLSLGKPSRFVSVRIENGIPGSVEVSAHAARVHFAAPQDAGSVVPLTVEFDSGGKGCPVAVTRKCAYARCHGEWYPVPLHGNPAAPGSMTIVVPAAWRTISNGELSTSDLDGKLRAERWTITAPAARSFVAGPYHLEMTVTGHRSVGAYLLSVNTDKARRCGALMNKILTALERRLGPYPYDALSLVEIPDELAGWNAASDNGLVLVASKWLEPTGCKLPLIAHELAHAWWGNHVRSCAPGSLMVDEGLAQYGAVLAIESAEGDDAALHFLRFACQGTSPCKSARGYFSHFYGQEDDKALMSLTGDDQDYLLASAKGPWVYHMLRREMGDELFFRTLRTFIGDRSGREASLADLRAAFLKAKPGDDRFATFVAQWLDRSGAPVLDVSWSAASNRGNAAEVTVRQRGAPYTLPLEICVAAGDECRTYHVQSTSRTQTYVLDAPGRPTDVKIDPAHRLLLWDSDYGELPVHTPATR